MPESDPKMATLPLVVIVDDDVAVATLHERFIEAHGRFRTVATALNGHDAVRAILDLEPDLVLLDFSLPGMSGLEVLREVRARASRQPEVIAVTAARDLDSVRRARTSGIRHYLVKPFTAAELRDRLDDVERERKELTHPAADRPLHQHDIDALLATRSHGRAAPPKGMSADTLDAVERVLRAAPGSSAAEVGSAAGVSRVSSRRYLEYLVEIRLATRDLDYTTSGRPSARYWPAKTGG